MTSAPSSPADDIDRLALMTDGRIWVSPVFQIALHTNRSFYTFRGDLLETFERFGRLCPPERLTFYATETMKAHQPVTKRALGMLPAWLATDAPPKHYLALELKASANHQDAPTAKYEIWSADASEQSNILSMSFPMAWGMERPDALLEFVQGVGAIFPYRCGVAGFALECSRYDRRLSESHAWSMSMRHPGLDIVRIPFDAKAVGGDAVSGVNWLTLIDAELLGLLGGADAVRSRLSAEITLIECGGGHILRAGRSPALGDVNRQDTLPLYREVYGLLEPWIDTAAKRSMAMRIGKDAVERTEAWYRRLRP